MYIGHDHYSGAVYSWTYVYSVYRTGGIAQTAHGEWIQDGGVPYQVCYVLYMYIDYTFRTGRVVYHNYDLRAYTLYSDVQTGAHYKGMYNFF